MPTAATSPTQEYEVREDFKGMWAVFRGDKLVTRTAHEAQARAYAASAEDAPMGKKPFASRLAPVETQD